MAAGTTALVAGFSSFSGFLGHTSLGEEDPLLSSVTAVLGGILGWLLGSQTRAPILLVASGAYATLAGPRMVLIKPLPEKDDKAHTAWLAPAGFVFGGLADLLSVGGKHFSVPICNWAMGHRPQYAYALPSMGVTAAAWGTIRRAGGSGNPACPRRLGGTGRLSVCSRHPDRARHAGRLITAPETGCHPDCLSTARMYRYPLLADRVSLVERRRCLHC